METILFAVWVTNTCNLKCTYCYEGQNIKGISMTHDIAETTIDFMMKILEEQKKKECIVVFHGGEPTLNMEIIRYIISRLDEYKRNYRIVYWMTTNAYKISEKDIQFIRSNIDELSVSIDGAEKTHDKNRVTLTGNLTHKYVMENVKKLTQGRKVRVRMTVNKGNHRDLFDNVLYLIQAGYKEIVPGIDYWDKTWEEEDFQELERQYIAIMNLLNTIEDDISVGQLDRKVVYKNEICDGGTSSFHINSDGNIFPCSYTNGVEQFCIGDIYQGIVQDKVKKFEQINLKDISSCQGCNNYDYCTSTRCKYINDMLTGDFLTPSPVICAEENLQINLRCLKKNEPKHGKEEKNEIKESY